MGAEANAMLAGLIVQAEARGTDMATLRALIEEASNLGAERALARLGLSDGDAGKDLGELRQLLQAWRDAKRTDRAAVIGWLVRGCLAVPYRRASGRERVCQYV